MRSRALLLLAGLVITAVPSALATYLVMSLPGSQTLDSGEVAYLLHNVRWPTRAVGGVLLLLTAVSILRRSRSFKTIAVVGAAAVLAGGVLYLSHHFSAPAFFGPPAQVRFARGTSEALPPETLVLGILRDGRARAYPIRLLAYHHLIRDEIDGEPLLPTY